MGTWIPKSLGRKRAPFLVLVRFIRDQQGLQKGSNEPSGRLRYRLSWESEITNSTAKAYRPHTCRYPIAYTVGHDVAL